MKLGLAGVLGGAGRICLCVAAGAIALATITGFAGDLAWFFDLPANLRPQLLHAGTLVGSLAAVLALRDHKHHEVVCGLVLVACIAVNLVSVAPLDRTPGNTGEGEACDHRAPEHSGTGRKRR
ncbi:MAG: hypothetical protein DYH08_06150 [Actinobacteria bacterium ATB1]|nr:hypothetical protein [Actinobacteria bacterium ATB1]